MIDLFNCLVESQKIPIFSVSGEPFNRCWPASASRPTRTWWSSAAWASSSTTTTSSRRPFEEHGVFHRTVMFVNQASDPIVERMLVPDMALAVAEKFAVEENKRVLVLLTDMTAYADAMKEIGVAQERIPATRGYMGDLYTQLAKRYEKACDFKGAGSVTILTVTTMPGNDVTHPVPDNTGYITEGQFYLHDGVIDPFGSLSRLKQRVGRQGHPRRPRPADEHDDPSIYSQAQRRGEASRQMAFELSGLRPQAAGLQRSDSSERFMDINVSMPLQRRAGSLLAAPWPSASEPEELLMKQELIDRYFPKLERDTDAEGKDAEGAAPAA